MSTKCPAGRSPPPRRGRPKDPDKRVAILMAAKQLFAQHGLERISMETIAKTAGVSKLTLYSHFANKDELFRQAVIAKCQEHTPEDIYDVNLRLPLRARLQAIGQGVLALVMSDEALNFYRMMAAQSRDRHRLGRLFWSAGPERAMDQFAQLLQAATAAGELYVPDPRRAAAHFFCLIHGEFHQRALVGALDPLSAAARTRHVRDVVDLFLRAYGARCN